MADLIYPAFKGRQNGAATPIDLDTDSIFVMLVDATYVGTLLSTLQGHDFRNDVTANEVSGTGYTAGGIALTSKTLTLSGANYVFDAADAAWAASTITARGAVLYKNVGTSATDPLIALFDFGTTVQSSNGTFTVQWNAAGLIEFA